MRSGWTQNGTTGGSVPASSDGPRRWSDAGADRLSRLPEDVDDHNRRADYNVDSSANVGHGRIPAGKK